MPAPRVHYRRISTIIHAGDQASFFVRASSLVVFVTSFDWMSFAIVRLTSTCTSCSAVIVTSRATRLGKSKLSAKSRYGITLKSINGHTETQSEFPISLVYHVRAGAKLGASQKMFRPITTVIEPSQNVLRGSGQPLRRRRRPE